MADSSEESNRKGGHVGPDTQDPTLQPLDALSDVSESSSEVQEAKRVEVVTKGWCSSSSGYHSGIGTSEVSHGELVAYDVSLTCEEISDENDDSDWDEEEWPVDRPLPLPEWGCERPELNFGNLSQYESFIIHIQEHLHKALATQCYDTVSNFVVFGEEYVSQREEYPCLDEFYRDYDPPMLPGRYTCVGLACDLATKLSTLEAQYPGLKDATYQVSCEEEIDNVDWYCSTGVPPISTCEKEHVLVCIRIRISDRPGMLLLDPGYHVGEPITVMEDGLYPQSGIIRANTTKSNIIRTYQYHYIQDNPAFVVWEVLEERDGEVIHEHTSLIHTARPFLSGIDVAERRNLAYPFKTLLGREHTGKLKCGLYFPLRECSQTNITFFHYLDGLPHHTRVPLLYFAKSKDNADEEGMISPTVEAILATVANGSYRSIDDLRATLESLASLLQDQDFLEQLAQLDKAIDSISKDN
ncbi:hypothetical protein SK128_000332 [Halocaridina rubra]|uniref:Uncharacterized protein n=1 Tax=Halocaridina rubra TaxID=373956 RepID=A0AAN9AAU1_HALRR